MEKFFINLGRKLGNSVNRGKWYYKSIFGSEEEALQAEYIMGKKFAADIERDMKVAGNSSLQISLDEIGGKLIKKVRNKQRQFNFNVILTNDINAFALPGGFIFITFALLDKINHSKDEIAFVLAHEIVHVVLKHPINRIVADYSTQIISNIVVKGGALGVLAKQALASMLKNCYSQDNELEADHYAVRMMYGAGFDPQSAKTLLARLKQSSPEDYPIYNYFLSHPPIDERIRLIDIVTRQRQM